MIPDPRPKNEKKLDTNTNPETLAYGDKASEKFCSISSPMVNYLILKFVVHKLKSFCLASCTFVQRRCEKL